MLNYIKHFPLHSLALRRDIPCTPRGPSLPKKHNISIPIAGSLLRLKAPRHRPFRRSLAQERLLPGRDLLLGQDLIRCGSKGVMANDSWGQLPGLFRSWAFWGPWLSGCKGELRLSISVIGRQPGYEFSNLSFFNPKAFEMVLVQYLNDLYGHLTWDSNERGTPRWHGPMDWKLHHHLPVFSVSFNVCGRGEDLHGKTGADRINLGGSYPDELFIFPITNHHFVKVYFKKSIFSKDDQRRPLFDTSPIKALQEAIFNSIELELSPEAQASYDKVKSEHRDMQLSKDFAPLKWPTVARGVTSEFGGDEPSEASLALRGGL